MSSLSAGQFSGRVISPSPPSGMRWVTARSAGSRAVVRGGIGENRPQSPEPSAAKYLWGPDGGAKIGACRGCPCRWKVRKR